MNVEADTIVNRVLDHIVTHNYVTYAQIARHLRAHGLEYKGTLSRCSQRDNNLIHWTGMSPLFSQIAAQLEQHPDIKLVPTIEAVYQIDGMWLTLPLAIRPPKRGYKKPHWLPVMFVNGGDVSGT